MMDITAYRDLRDQNQMIKSLEKFALLEAIVQKEHFLLRVVQMASSTTTKEVRVQPIVRLAGLAIIAAVNLFWFLAQQECSALKAQ